MSEPNNETKPFIPSIPQTNSAVKSRGALNMVQMSVTLEKIEFYKEMHALESKYAKLFEPIYKKRHEITSSEIDLSDSDCDLAIEDAEDTTDVHKEIGKKDATSNTADFIQKSVVNEIGVYGFWYTVFRHAIKVCGMIEGYDWSILRYLKDVKVIYNSNPDGYTIEFHFDENNFFTNSVLTKKYEIGYDLEAHNPFKFDGPEFISLQGCTINWKRGNNITMEKVRLRAKTICGWTTKIRRIKKRSFFNFFDYIDKETVDDKKDKAKFAALNEDFEVGYHIAKEIVPKAILIYTTEYKFANDPSTYVICNSNDDGSDDLVNNKTTDDQENNSDNNSDDDDDYYDVDDDDDDDDDEVDNELFDSIFYGTDKEDNEDDLENEILGYNCLIQSNSIMVDDGVKCDTCGDNQSENDEVDIDLFNIIFYGKDENYSKENLMNNGLKEEECDSNITKNCALEEEGNYCDVVDNIMVDNKDIIKFSKHSISQNSDDLMCIFLEEDEEDQTEFVIDCLQDETKLDDVLLSNGDHCTVSSNLLTRTFMERNEDESSNGAFFLNRNMEENYDLRKVYLDDDDEDEEIYAPVDNNLEVENSSEENEENNGLIIKSIKDHDEKAEGNSSDLNDSSIVSNHPAVEIEEKITLVNGPIEPSIEDNCGLVNIEDKRIYIALPIYNTNI